MAQKRKYLRNYNTVSNSNKNPTVRMVRMGTNAEEAGRWQYEWVMEAPKKWMMILQVVLRGATKRTKSKSNQKKVGAGVKTKKL
jgi:hypothetical protein